MEPKISIIIPVYNKEKYLSRCLDSVNRQTFIDFECILVDDGSTDNSQSICNKYVSKNKVFKYFYQNNSGPAAARSFGIQKAQSNMIMLIDADDWIGNNTIEIFYNEYKKNNADIIFNTIKNVVKNNVSILEKSIPIKKNQFPLCYYLDPFVEKGGYNKLINKKLWENIYIPEKSRYEDFITGVQMFSLIDFNNIDCISIPNLYFYWKDAIDSSLSSGAKDYFNKPYNKINDIYIFEWIENYISSLKSDKKEEIEASYALFFMNTIVFPYIIKSNYITKQEVLKFYIYYKKALTCGNFSFLRNIYINIYYRSFFFGKLFQKIISIFRK